MFTKKSLCFFKANPNDAFLLKSLASAASRAKLDSLVRNFFKPPWKLKLSATFGPLCIHCCLDSHFWAQRIWAACLAFLGLKVPTSFLTKAPIVSVGPLRSLTMWKKSSVDHHLVSKNVWKLDTVGICQPVVEQWYPLTGQGRVAGKDQKSTWLGMSWKGFLCDIITHWLQDLVSGPHQLFGFSVPQSRWFGKYIERWIPLSFLEQNRSVVLYISTNWAWNTEIDGAQTFHFGTYHEISSHGLVHFQ